MRLSVTRNAGGAAAATLLLAAIVVTYTHAVRVNPTTAALTFLLLVLWLAAQWGLGIAIYTSLAAGLCFNYFFLPPINTFSIAETQNWVALAAFLATALIGSNLANRLQAAHAASQRRGAELELLYDFSQRLLAPETSVELLRALPSSLATAFGCAEAAVYLLEGEQLYATALTLQEPLPLLRAASTGPGLRPGPLPLSMLVPLAVGVRRIGAMYLARGAADPMPRPETLEALGSLVALSLERAAAMEKLVHAEASAESERLRATLLDAVTHELRTPLTSIKAAVTALLSQAALLPGQRQEMLTVIDEESDRLNHLIAQAVEMAELDARALRLNRRACSLEGLVAEILQQAQACWPTRTLVQRPAVALGASQDDWDSASVDPPLIGKVLLHLLENAVKYSPAETPIEVSVEGRGRSLQVSVHDRGPGIPASEQERIFDKFYRSPAHRFGIPGTGMGLPIARAIIEEHGGTLTVDSDPQHGSVFRFTVPRS